MMVMSPYPGFDGEGFSMPVRDVIPKPLQKPHPPLWMACTNRDTIRVAARNGVGALAFSFVDPDEARSWSSIYYDIIRSEDCVPIGHTVNANIAMVSGFSLHHERDEAIRRGQEGFEFFAYALRSLVTRDSVPGRSTLWRDFLSARAATGVEDDTGALQSSGGIGTPDDLRGLIRSYEEAGVDQIIFLQQAGRNPHREICQSLELFAAEVLPEFRARRDAREAAKAEDLRPWVEAALARRTPRPALADAEIPVIRASVERVAVNRAATASR